MFQFLFEFDSLLFLLFCLVHEGLNSLPRGFRLPGHLLADALIQCFRDGGATLVHFKQFICCVFGSSGEAGLVCNLGHLPRLLVELVLFNVAGFWMGEDSVDVGQQKRDCRLYLLLFVGEGHSLSGVSVRRGRRRSGAFRLFPWAKIWNWERRKDGRRSVVWQDCYRFAPGSNIFLGVVKLLRVLILVREELIEPYPF